MKSKLRHLREYWRIWGPVQRQRPISTETNTILLHQQIWLPNKHPHTRGKYPIQPFPPFLETETAACSLLKCLFKLSNIRLKRCSQTPQLKQMQQLPFSSLLHSPPTNSLVDDNVLLRRNQTEYLHRRRVVVNMLPQIRTNSNNIIASATLRAVVILERQREQISVIRVTQTLYLTRREP